MGWKSSDVFRSDLGSPPLRSNDFWPHFEKQDGRHRLFVTFINEFCWPSGANGIIGRDIQFDMFLITKS